DAALVEWLWRSAVLAVERRHGTKHHESPELPEVSAVARLCADDDRSDADAPRFLAGPGAGHLAATGDVRTGAAFLLPDALGRAAPRTRRDEHDSGNPPSVPVSAADVRPAPGARQRLPRLARRHCCPVFPLPLVRRRQTPAS